MKSVGDVHWHVGIGSSKEFSGVRVGDLQLAVADQYPDQPTMIERRFYRARASIVAYFAFAERIEVNATRRNTPDGIDRNWIIVRHAPQEQASILHLNDLGRQLPYIDRVKTVFVADPQVQVLQMLSGDVDCEFRALDLRDLYLYKLSEERGQFSIRMWQLCTGAEPVLIINWSPQDLVLRRLFRDQRFRKALALGVDREKIDMIVYRGSCEPQGATISREAWHFADEEGQ